MNIRRILKITFLAILVASTAMGQNKKFQYSFEKGEVMDVLLLNWHENVDSLFVEYRKKALPEAAKLTYENLGVHGITETMQGNTQPEIMLLGKWKNLKLREQFLVDIETKVPDFHDRRRALWSFFGLTYFEMPEDVTFTLDRNKYNVLTAYWKDSDAKFNAFVSQFQNLTQKNKGEQLMSVSNGKSPFGYYYQPDYLEITAWESKEAFDAFYKQNLKMNPEGLKQVNQFILY